MSGSAWVRACFGAAVALVTTATLLPMAHAHGISETSRATMSEGGTAAFVWLGAEHMVTGYDHLLFLFGVLFFLSGFRDVVRFITAFTLGHCITLLGATLLGISADPHLIDAVIAVSVMYKGFENLDGFDRVLGVRAPNLLLMVFVFGLIHGFGLSTRLQQLSLGGEGLVVKILAFNVGVELGQVAALTVMLGVFRLWRSAPSFEQWATTANIVLVAAGMWLFVFQMASYFGDAPAHDHHVEDHAHPDRDHTPHEHAHEVHTDDEKGNSHAEHEQTAS